MARRDPRLTSSRSFRIEMAIAGILTAIGAVQTVVGLYRMIVSVF